MRRRRWCKRATKTFKKSLDEPRSWRWPTMLFYVGRLAYALGLPLILAVCLLLEPLLVQFPWTHGVSDSHGKVQSALEDILQYNILQLLVVLLLLANLLSWLGKRTLVTKLKPMRYACCPRCFARLRVPEPVDRRCPGCGKFSPRRDAVLTWAKLLRSRI